MADDVLELTSRVPPMGANPPGIGARADIYDVATLFLQKQYQIPSYQRDFSWKDKHVQQLLDDLVASWLARPVSGRGDDPQYFLGAIVTQIRLINDEGEDDAADKIVDGQQRVTVLLLLITALARLTTGDTRQSLLSMIYRSDIDRFILDSHGYNHALRRYLKNASQAYNDGLPPKLSGQPPFRTTAIENLDVAFKLIHKRLVETVGRLDYESGRYKPDELNASDLTSFANWLTQNVFLAVIADTDPDDDQRLFDRINTRGLPLSEGDRFKSQVVAGSGRGARSRESKRWQKARDNALATLNTAGQIGAAAVRDSREAERRLLAGWLLANQFDLNQIDEKVRKAAVRATRDPFEYSLDRSLDAAGETSAIDNPTDIHSELYDQLRAGYFPYTRKPTNAYKASFTYQKRLVGLQHAQIANLPFMDGAIAACHRRTRRERTKRLAALSVFADILSFHSGWNGHWATKRRLELAMLEATDLLGNAPVQALGNHLFGLLDTDTIPSIAADRAPSRSSSNQKWIRYLLGRMAISLEAFAYGKSGPSEYIDGIGNRAPEIEHLVSRNFAENGEGFNFNPDEIDVQRERLGALTLLAKEDNREASNRKWEERLPIYARSNLLSKSLEKSVFDNHGRAFINAAPVTAEFEFRPWHRLTKDNIDARQVSYTRLARKIWAPHRLLTLDA